MFFFGGNIKSTIILLFFLSPLYISKWYWVFKPILLERFLLTYEEERVEKEQSDDKTVPVTLLETIAPENTLYCICQRPSFSLEEAQTPAAQVPVAAIVRGYTGDRTEYRQKWDYHELRKRLHPVTKHMQDNDNGTGKKEAL